jgi:transglutaminase-like putative cysteine protease
MTRFRVAHHNIYRYDAAVSVNYGEARLLPRDTPGQRVIEATLRILPEPDDKSERLDPYGNRVVWFSLGQPHTLLEIESTALIERLAPEIPDESPPWEMVTEAMETSADPETILAREFRLASQFVPIETGAIDYARASFTPGRPILDALADLSARVREDFAYSPAATDISTPLTEVLRERHGVCQDFAHLCLSGLRGLGFAARYVSGWLETEPPPGVEPLQGADASHAWIAVHVPGLGWVDYDPTNGAASGSGHLTLAWGRDFADVTPLKGVIYGGGRHVLEVGVTVERLDQGKKTKREPSVMRPS